ncbi:D123-domain-containing protein [Xylariales sp. PMI_506]|nr:D123-domain-containing protein [Xylariales sp. PMI_506]
MPISTQPAPGASNSRSGPAPELHFPPITRDHILHCSYDYWFPKYRASCIKSRIIPLTPEFVEYIREDGITLADEDDQDDEDDIEWEGPTSTSRVFPEEVDSDSESEDEAPAPLPPNKRFPELHQTIKDKISEVGGAAAPKLNWTSPKDASWISPHQNTVKCTSPNDIYLLLKSSNFVTYDLEHAFDDCTPISGASTTNPPTFNPVLVLRSFFNPHTALEFRCFVKYRNLVGICQRDLKYYEFLMDLRPSIVAKISQFFNHKLRYTFPEGSFAFDVYIPEGEDEPLGRVRLIDINAWAPHTDSLLFGWDELNDWDVPGPIIGVAGREDEGGVQTGSEATEDEDDDEDEDIVPELRLIEKEDQAAYNLSSPAYSAHKLPKDVVDASLAGDGGMREFAQKWREMTEYRSHLANWEKDDKEGQ